MTKQHGMLFADRLMPPLLDGRKTQTRRPPRRQPQQRGDGSWEMRSGRSRSTTNWRRKMVYDEASGVLKSDEHYMVPVEEWLMDFCPYSVGDLIWARETWAPDDDLESYWGGIEAFPDDARTWESMKFRATASDFELKTTKWRPSIHMPKWACRCWLEITDVRVQRVQEISGGDVYAEGIEYLNGRYTWNGGLAEYRSLTDAFCGAWSSIYPGTWEENIWVWALTFKRVEAPQ